jgi:hypothetical protein
MLIKEKEKGNAKQYNKDGKWIGGEMICEEQQTVTHHFLFYFLIKKNQ